MILGIGLDLLHLPRLHRLLTRHAPLTLAKRILSPTELDSFTTKFPISQISTPNSALNDEMVRFLAVRWSVKEAAYKALFPRWKLSWKDVTIWKDGPKPKLLLPQEIILNTNIRTTHLSLSHDGDYVSAQVLFEGESDVFDEMESMEEMTTESYLETMMTELEGDGKNVNEKEKEKANEKEKAPAS